MNYIRLFLLISVSVVFSALSILFTPINYFKGIGTYFVYRIFAKTVLLICGAKVKISQNGNIIKDKEYIIISNHLSYLDIPVLMVSMPKNIRFIYKKSLTRIPIFGWSLFLGGYIPIDRSNARNAIESLKKAAKRLKEGVSIAIFPEGTRSKTGITGEFKKGIFMLAEFAETEIIPVTIIGTNRILQKDSLKINPGHVEVIINEPLEFKRDKEFLNEVRNKIVYNTTKFKIG